MGSKKKILRRKHDQALMDAGQRIISLHVHFHVVSWGPRTKWCFSWPVHVVKRLLLPHKFWPIHDHYHCVLLTLACL